MRASLTSSSAGKLSELACVEWVPTLLLLDVAEFCPPTPASSPEDESPSPAAAPRSGDDAVPPSGRLGRPPTVLFAGAGDADEGGDESDGEEPMSDEPWRVERPTTCEAGSGSDGDVPDGERGMASAGGGPLVAGLAARGEEGIRREVKEGDPSAKRRSEDKLGTACGGGRRLWGERLSCAERGCAGVALSPLRLCRTGRPTRLVVEMSEGRGSERLRLREYCAQRLAWDKRALSRPRSRLLRGGPAQCAPWQVDDKTEGQIHVQLRTGKGTGAPARASCCQPAALESPSRRMSTSASTRTVPPDGQLTRTSDSSRHTSRRSGRKSHPDGRRSCPITRNLSHLSLWRLIQLPSCATARRDELTTRGC